MFDVELPAHFAKQYFFRYYIPLDKFKQLNPSTYSYSYRIFVRYPPPGDSYTVKIGLHPNDKIRVDC